MKNLYGEITNRIIDQLEQGVIPWKKPWKKPWSGRRSGAISYATGRPYSLLNQMLLLKPGEYATFNQIKAAGGKVNKGAHAKIVAFWKVVPRELCDGSGQPVRDADGNPVVQGLPVLRYFQVFHVTEDCTGIVPKWADAAPAADAPDDAAAVFAGYIGRENISLQVEISDEAYYSPARDLIHLPKLEQFDSAAEYYGTAFHEAVHSTGHRSRLNRFEASAGAAAFGSQSYSKEELVAEIGSAAILHQLGMETPQTFRNSAAYVQSWLRALKNDKQLIVSAAARAEKAVNLIFGNE